MSAFLATHTRTHSCGALRAADVGKRGRPDRLGPVATETTAACVFIDLRDREGLTQLRLRRLELAKAASTRSPTTLRSEWCIGIVGEVRSRGTAIDASRQGAQPREREARDRRDRGLGRPSSRCSRRPRRRRSRSRTTSTPTTRCASSTATSICAARRCRRTSSMRSKITRTTRDYLGKQRLPRDRDAVHGEVHAGRRAQLPRAVAAQPRQLLRARRVAADLQAAADGRGLRALLPDRALLPRRGSAPRSPARVHADRHRDVVRQRADPADHDGGPDRGAVEATCSASSSRCRCAG